MTQDHPSKLSFSIEESVWLNKGQEISEILSMSLDPEITIEESEQHVFIRGGLQLVGEYRPNKNVPEEENIPSNIDELASFRSIEQVTVSEDGIGEIKHYFPIDVTIPLNRINNLEDVYVQVETFDYDLPERGCIQLTADVTISGMATHEVERTNEVQEEPEEQLEEQLPVYEQQQAPPEPAFRSFQFEARQRPAAPPEPIAASQPRAEGEGIGLGVAPVESTPQEEEVKEPVLATGAEQASEEEEPVPTVVTAPRAGERKEDNQVQATAALQVESEEAHEDIEEVEEQDEVQDEVRNEEEHQTKINLAPLKDLAVVNTDQSNEVEEGREEEVEPERPTSQKDENALYLTKMLTNGEEQFSKLRMCIIQENESLDTIAERYQLQTSHLVRVNRLENEQVEEGQIIYIPKR
ncbi:stage VI sporulation protein D [Bacillus alkalicellulosilyticus]|uniref:stage VI sporulation protein D n=1 Tax=Alkalihalobacterium alkalicellulosilyticum TaxID=1912214 RepID=UPI001483BB9E|nr:stage VI sporulation protein D [Bacillus alkalicellulosilyticus]